MIDIKEGVFFLELYFSNYFAINFTVEADEVNKLNNSGNFFAANIDEYPLVLTNFTFVPFLFSLLLVGRQQLHSLSLIMRGQLGKTHSS